MTYGTHQPYGCGYLSYLSLIASVMGSALAATVCGAMHYSQADVGSGLNVVGNFLLMTVVIGYFGTFIAVPIGLLFGIPLLGSCRRYLHRTALAAMIFAMIGLLGGLAIQRLDGATGLDNAELVFGACIGGMHPLVYGRAIGVAWSRICAALLLSAAIVPSVAYASEDLQNAVGSRREFEKRCPNNHRSMAFVRDRADVEKWGIPPPYDGRWLNNRKWRSLYEREDMALLDDDRVLIARDYAYVPGGFVGWITGGRRVERHCMTEKRGAEAESLRRRGFGVRPSIHNLAD